MPSFDQQGWMVLAGRAQAGDKKAYAKLLRSLFPYIRSYLIPRVANAEWAEDITQDVLISVHKALHTYSPYRPFKPWLHAIISFRRLITFESITRQGMIGEQRWMIQISYHRM